MLRTLISVGLIVLAVGCSSNQPATVVAKQPCQIVYNSAGTAVKTTTSTDTSTTVPCRTTVYVTMDSVLPDGSRVFTGTRVDSIGIDGSPGSMMAFSAPANPPVSQTRKQAPKRP